ncbi:WD40-repeat-containing domain protein [Blakeslea trispora]|nr:WD40-repeat-containing domain protein [Blakeslea trispora]
MAYVLSFWFTNTSKNTPAKHIDKEGIHIPTYITISPRKDGTTAKIKCLNPQYTSHSLNPFKRKLQASSSNISAILPKLKARSSVSHRRSSSIYSSTSYSSTEYSTSLLSGLSKCSSLVYLPNEIILNILFYLDYKSTQKLSRTCSRMYIICRDDELWRKLLYADFRSIPPPIQSSMATDEMSSALVTTRQKKRRASSSISIPSKNLKLYQNRLKLDRRWLTGKVDTHFLQGHSDSVYCLAWIGPNVLVSGSRDKSLKVWDVVTSQCIKTVRHCHDSSILSLRVNKDRSIMLTGSSDATCILWSLPDLTPIKKLQGHGHSVLDVCFVNGLIVTASRDHTLRVWNPSTGTEICRMTGHTASVNAVEPIECRNQIVSASGDSTLKLWDVASGECLKTMEGHRLGLATVRFNGKYLFSGGLEGKIKVWDIDTGECVNTLIGHVGMIRSIDCVEVSREANRKGDNSSKEHDREKW